MLDKYTDESFDRTEAYTMDHNRTFLCAVFICVSKVKSFRKVHIKLNCTTLPCSSDGVLKMEVDLRSVECSVTFVYNIVDSHIFKGASKAVCCLLPSFIASHAVLRTCRKLNMIFESEKFIYAVDKVYYALDLISYLVLCHKDMSIVLCEASNSHKTMESS